MPRILCTLENASTSISGVAFISHKLGMISEEVDAAVAKKFATIKGYSIYDPNAPPASAAAPGAVTGKCPACGHDPSTAAPTAPATDPAALAILAQARRNEQAAADAAAKAKQAPPASTPAPGTPPLSTAAGAPAGSSASTPPPGDAPKSTPDPSF